MRYCAIALDFDGPIGQDRVVPAQVVEGLRRLKATGRTLLLVTGRELRELLAIFPEIGIFDRVVAENGAGLYRPASGESQDLGDPPPPALVGLLRERGVPISVGDTIIATVEPYESTVLRSIHDLGLEHPVIFNKGAVMILPPGINKASGLAVALRELGLSARNVVAVGDAENDHALFEAVEYAVAVSNAVATLQAAADRVTAAPRGDGVLEVIADLIESDLAHSPPARTRRAIILGRDANGAAVRIPAAGVSMLVTGAPRNGKSSFTHRLLDRLRAWHGGPGGARSLCAGRLASAAAGAGAHARRPRSARLAAAHRRCAEADHAAAGRVRSAPITLQCRTRPTPRVASAFSPLAP